MAQTRVPVLRLCELRGWSVVTERPTLCKRAQRMGLPGGSFRSIYGVLLAAGLAYGWRRQECLCYLLWG